MIRQIIKEEIQLLKEYPDHLYQSYEEAVNDAKEYSKRGVMQHVIEVPYYGDSMYNISSRYVDDNTLVSFKDGEKVEFSDDEDFELPKPTRKRNVKTVRITVPDERTLRRIKNTDTFKYLSRLDLKVGENIENVNHTQFSRQKRLFPIIGVNVEEI